MEYLEIKYRDIIIYAFTKCQIQKFTSNNNGEAFIRTFATSILNTIKNQVNGIPTPEIFDNISTLLDFLAERETNQVHYVNATNDEVSYNKDSVILISNKDKIYSTIPKSSIQQECKTSYSSLLKGIVSVVGSYKPGIAFSVRYHTNDAIYEIADTTQMLGTMTVQKMTC